MGAGAAGSVLAAELSASGAQVLVIEAGGPDDAPTTMNPSVWFYNVAGPLDYHLPIAPSPRLNNRKFNMALGHVLGGGTSINAMVWMRCMQRDYDRWAENGAKGWAFDDVLRVFKAGRKTQKTVAAKYHVQRNTGFHGDDSGKLPSPKRSFQQAIRAAIRPDWMEEHFPACASRV